jgi:glycosyltransferase involved in cell wall biosynthesis
MSKLLSIITINYNNAKGLEQTLSSLISQSYRDFELIVMDGGSKDDSTEIIKKYKSIVSFSVSERDKGIYDAQNKGIQKATGKYLLFLNSGDYLVNEKVLEEFAKFVEGKDHLLVYGNTKLLKENGEFHHNIIQPDPLTAFYFYNNTLNHQSCFIQKKLFNKYGLYKLDYKICSDFEFFLNVFLHQKEAYVHMNTFVANYLLGGFSSDPMNYDAVVKDKQTILANYFTKKELADFRSQYRRQNSTAFNIRNWLYNNRITYPIIQWYVKMKGGISVK